MGKSLDKQSIQKISFFHVPGHKESLEWKNKITKWIKINFPGIKIVSKDYDALIVLGGDGTMLRAAKICQKHNAVIIGLNLGTVGFLSSVREPKNFLSALKKFLTGNFYVTERGMLEAKIIRGKKSVFSTNALNEIIILNPLGMVEIKVEIDGYMIQKVRGSGILLSTATGSTAYNLSAHGPIAMPDAKNFILTELLDHDIPPPSIVLNETQEVALKVENFRKRELLSVSKTGKKADVMFIADGETVFPLEKNDYIVIRKFPATVKIAEFEKNYFLKSLREKFTFK